MVAAPEDDAEEMVEADEDDVEAASLEDACPGACPGASVSDVGSASNSTSSVSRCRPVMRSSNGAGFSTCTATSHRSPSTHWKSVPAHEIEK